MLRRDFLSTSLFAMGAGGVSRTLLPPSARNVLDNGAQPDGKALCTEAIQRAIDDAYRAGGGIVFVPPGVFLVGGLELRSHVTLYLEAGSVLLGSKDIRDYTYHSGPPRKGDANGHHLLFARDAEDITVWGSGTIDGQGPAYWRNVHRAPVSPEDLWADVFTFDYLPIDNLRPSPMLEFVNCRNVHISGITLKNASGWTLRPVACETVVLDGIRIRNPRIGPNTDGLDITASRNVLVSNCDIETGDDAICIKSENPYGEVLPTKNVTIANCVLSTSCNGFKIGTATRGAVENIVFTNSIIYTDSKFPINARVIGGINIEMVDGGSVDGISVSNIRMENTRTPVFVRLGQRTPGPHSFLRNVRIDGIDASGALVTSSITGVPGLRVSDVTISNSRIRTEEGGKSEWARRSIPEMETRYPESRMFGRLPAYGMYIRHADRIRLQNVELVADKPDARPAVVCDDVADLLLSGLETTAPAGSAPLVALQNTRHAFVSGSRVPQASEVFVHVSGRDSQNIAVAGNALNPSQKETVYSDAATAPAGAQ